MALTDKVAFTTLANLKTDLGITGSTFDTTLERRILAASELIEGWLGRKLRRETVTDERFAGNGWPTAYLARSPIVSITSITFDGATVSSTAYRIQDAERGCLYREDGWTWTAAVLESISPAQIGGTEDRAFLATYVGGYVLPNDTTQNPTAPVYMLPSAIEEACLLWATDLHRSAGSRSDVVQEQVGDASVAYAVNSIEERAGAKPPAAIARLLARYRRIL